MHFTNAIIEINVQGENSDVYELAQWDRLKVELDNQVLSLTYLGAVFNGVRYRMAYISPRRSSYFSEGDVLFLQQLATSARRPCFLLKTDTDYLHLCEGSSVHKESIGRFRKVANMKDWQLPKRGHFETIWSSQYGIYKVDA